MGESDLVIELQRRVEALEKRLLGLDMVDVPCMLTSPNGRLPKSAKELDVASDLYAICYDADGQEIPETTIRPQSRKRFGAGFAMALPVGYRGVIVSRSGLSRDFGIEAGAGLIDNGYRDEVGIMLYNNSQVPFVVRTGMRIAQISIERYTHAGFVPTDSLSQTARGGTGWGSSGYLEERQ